MRNLILFGFMVLAVLLLGCNTKTQGTITEENNTESALSGTITIDGSSTVYPISAAVAETFIKLNPNVNVTVSFSGTGGGFKKFYSGDIEISDASRPIKSKEQNQCKAAEVEFIELPVAYDGIGVYVNPQNNWCSSLTVDELHKIWKPGSRITNWNQIRPDFPEVPLQLYGPGADSGTFDYFTEAINGKSTASRPNYTKSEDDNVLVNGISGNVGALGYFGLAYYEANKDKLKLIGIDDEDDSNGKGAIKPSLETVANGTYQPLARPIFIYINKTEADRPEVDAFVTYYIQSAAEHSRKVGYVPLPKSTYNLVMKRFTDRIAGTMFGRDTVGITMDDLLKLEK